MSSMKKPIWFWQLTCSPHMTALAEALAERGFHVTFVANKLLSTNRVEQGWEQADFNKVRLKLAVNKNTVTRLASEAPRDAIHLCQGLRGNGIIGNAQSIFRKKGLNHWVFMEIVDDAGWLGLIKRVVYRILFLHWRNHLSGVLAIGHNAPDWFVARGMKKNRIFNFAYFLKNPQVDELFRSLKEDNESRPFRFVFVGRLIKLKKVDYLLKALANLKLKNFELWVVGDGPEKNKLCLLADSLLSSQVRWFGTQPISKVPKIISQTDCLVLPSRYDGWGAVISESLMVGTPVICSNLCGAASVVAASREGSIFKVNEPKSLEYFLMKQINKGVVDIEQRQMLAKWSKCLDADSGAEYLEKILFDKSQIKIDEPWA
tara:strand:- start:5570 stop:6691 length:1122 start_codon:yes stop_codon:yes gene_type:complete